LRRVLQVAQAVTGKRLQLQIVTPSCVLKHATQNATFLWVKKALQTTMILDHQNIFNFPISGS
jgi:hypothetical protein